MKKKITLAFIFNLILVNYAFAQKKDLNSTLQNKNVIEEIANSETWLGLLHIRKNSKPSQLINSNQFFITWNKDFSPYNELIETIKLIYGKNSKQNTCKYPARTYFLNKKLSFNNDNLNRIIQML